MNAFHHLPQHTYLVQFCFHDLKSQRFVSFTSHADDRTFKHGFDVRSPPVRTQNRGVMVDKNHTPSTFNSDSTCLSANKSRDKTRRALYHRMYVRGGPSLLVGFRERSSIYLKHEDMGSPVNVQHTSGTPMIINWTDGRCPEYIAYHSRLC